jgi:hypothetical protein
MEAAGLSLDAQLLALGGYLQSLGQRELAASYEVAYRHGQVSLKSGTCGTSAK